jgi:L-ascorbate metabolism protein UlaG (beta-lactamase superfamily)
VSIRLIGGPTTLIEIGGLRPPTDPTFDPPRAFEDNGVTVVSKLTGRALRPDEIGGIDAVLSSHDEHPDNLDEAGRAFLTQVPLVFTTSDGTQRRGGRTRGLRPWDTATLNAPHGQKVTITAMPAQHGPTPQAHQVTGNVVGFLLTDSTRHSVYVSGDNASVDVVRQIVERIGVPQITVLFTGGASLPFLFDGDFITLTATRAAEAAHVLAGSAIIPAISTAGPTTPTPKPRSPPPSPNPAVSTSCTYPAPETPTHWEPRRDT